MSSTSGNSGSAKSPTIRVLHLGKYYPPHRGGIETFLRELMIAQQRQGLTAAALVHASRRTFRTQTEYPHEQDQRLIITRAARWLTLAFAPISPTYPLVLRRCIRQQRPDVLHIHLPNVSPFWCLFSPSARRIPWVVHWHADVLTSTHSMALSALYPLYKPFEQAILRRAAKIVVTSPPYLQTSEPLAPHRERCEVVPLGLAAARPTEPGPERETNHSALLRVLFVGRLSYYKGLSYLIKAVSKSDRIRLRVVGNGDQEAALVNLACSLGLQERVQFLGSLSDGQLNKEFAESDCVCLPSIERTEAFGVVLLEAMRASKAVVATKVRGSGMAWVVEDEKTGLLVEPENEDELQRNLERLADDPAFATRLGVAGRERFNAFFTIDRCAQSLTRIYQTALAADCP